MIGLVTAHVAGVPLEETLPALGGMSTVMLVVRTWLTLRVRRRRRGPAR